MTYISDITDALTRVITVANDGPEEKFLGYAANRDFWVQEALHCLRVMDGYPDRFAKMQKTSAARHPAVDDPNRRIDDPSTSQRKLIETRTNLQKCMQKFLNRCLKLDRDDYHPITQDCKKLDIPIPP